MLYRAHESIANVPSRTQLYCLRRFADKPHMRKPLYILGSRSLKRSVKTQRKLARVVSVPFPFTQGVEGKGKLVSAAGLLAKRIRCLARQKGKLCLNPVRGALSPLSRRS